MCAYYDSEEAHAVEPAYTLCDDCEGKVHVGDWPICTGPHGNHEPQSRYRPFIPFYDHHLKPGGVFIDSLATWNRVMKETGFEMSSPKHDRDRPHPLQDPDHIRRRDLQFNQAFNKAAQERYGHMGLGDILRDDD